MMTEYEVSQSIQSIREAALPPMRKARLLLKIERHLQRQESSYGLPHTCARSTKRLRERSRALQARIRDEAWECLHP